VDGEAESLGFGCIEDEVGTWTIIGHCSQT
jgi:hypothetical protein